MEDLKREYVSSKDNTYWKDNVKLIIKSERIIEMEELFKQ
jgi:hypothetical protein